MILPFSSVNWVAVLVSTVAMMAFGMLWYSSLLFGKVWMRSIGIKEGEMPSSEMGKGVILGLINQFVRTSVLALALIIMSPKTLQEGLLYGGILWLGFEATVIFGGVIWEKKPHDFFCVSVCFNFLSMLISVLILMKWPW
ncbi:DUF1761 domain-containing protein [Candidatus Peregrinibacteria bacterium]|nr:DUF1761 domain-containing protein [Candidatus Peregrinibacteria bacterium]